MLTLLSDPGVLKSLGVTAPLWSFAVCVCGTDYLLKNQTEPPLRLPIALPSYHLHGADDNILPASQALLAKFDRPHLATHPWGHAVPLALAMSHGHIIEGLQAFVK